MANKPTQPVFPLGLAAEEQSTLAGVLNTGTIEHGPDAVLTLPEGNASAGLPSSVRYNADSDEFEGFYENGGWLPLGGGGIRWEVLPHASTATLTGGRGYLINNTTGVSTVVLPSPTRVGDSVTICDAYGKFATYPLTVSPSGNNLYGSTEDMAITTDNVSATFTWSGPEQGWIITSGVGLGQGRVYSREIFTKILASETSSVALNTPPTIVDVYADGKRLVESKYSLDGNVIIFSPSLPASTELQVIEYTPIQLGIGDGPGSSTITWVYNGGSAIGGETEITLDVVVDDVPAIDINGSRQYKNLGFTFDPLTSKITLAQELEPEDEVVVIINGTPNIYNQIDHTLQEVARSSNVKDTDVVMSSHTNVVITGKKVIYDVVAQKYWGLPDLPPNAYIVKVEGKKLTYNPGSVTVDLIDKFGSRIEDESAAYSGVNTRQLIRQREEALSPTNNVVRFVTWNNQGANSIYHYYGNDYASSQRVIDLNDWYLRMGADFIGGQEHYTVPNLPNTALTMYPYQSGFHSNSEWFGTGRNYGNMVAATRPLKNSTSTKYSSAPNPGDPSDTEYRTYIRTEMVVNGVTIAIYNTHLALTPSRITAMIAELAGKLVTETASHIVLMGDWNTQIDSDFQPFLNLGFTMVNKYGELNTNNVGGTWYLDRIFHKGFSKQGDYGVFTTPISLGDHKPLYVDLTV